MIRHLKSYVILLVLGLTIFTGCNPQQPFYFHEDGDLSHYINEVQKIEYADVDTASGPVSVMAVRFASGIRSPTWILILILLVINTVFLGNRLCRTNNIRRG